jgi:hypothetical protein
MSEIWEGYQKKLEELKNKFFPGSAIVSIDFDRIITAELKPVELGRMVAIPSISSGKIWWIDYILSLSLEDRNMARILEIIYKDENVDSFHSQDNLDRKVEGVTFYRGKWLPEPLLHVRLQKDKILLRCYNREATRIVDKIKNVFGVS